MIFMAKESDDRVILSCGHAYLALRVIMEDLGLDVPKDFRTHPDRGGDVHCSTGSLGMGFPIALGMALAKPQSTVHCVCSDGEFSEGSMWEALRIMTDLPIPNVQLYIIANGFSAYGEINVKDLIKRLMPFNWKMKQSLTVFEPQHPECLAGVAGHYKKINSQIYDELRRLYAE